MQYVHCTSILYHLNNICQYYNARSTFKQWFSIIFAMKDKKKKKKKRHVKDRCLMAKWKSLPCVFLCILKFIVYKGANKNGL